MVRRKNTKALPTGFAPAFAPAFARKPQNPESDDVAENQYEFMIAPNVNLTSTWNTVDPQTKQVIWTNEEPLTPQGESTLKPGPWNRWGHGEQTTANTGQAESASADGQSDNHAVKSLFVGDQDIMGHNTAPRNEFEARNRSALGLGRKGNAVVNMIGNDVVSTVKDSIDERLRLMDRNGNYIDGKHRGLPPKRLLDERASRFHRRDEEIEHASAVLQEWNSLSPNDQLERLAKARHNKDVMIEMLVLEVEHKIPEAYDPEQEEPLFVDYVDDEAPQTPTTADSAAEPLESSRKKGRFEVSTASLPSRGDGFGAGTPVSRPGGYQARGGRFKKTGYGRTNVPHTMRTPRRPSSIVSGPASVSESGFSVMPPDLESLDTERSKLSVTNWPMPVPFEDFDVCPSGLDSQNLDQQQISIYQRFLDRCSKRPRLVTVSLHPDVKFTSEALVSRVFGGPVQQIQFFPDEAQALVLFIKPQDAKAFISHVHNCRDKSALEYRRLQIAAEWHRGKWREAVVKQTKYVARVALFRGGTRVLLIDNVSPRVKQEHLLGIFKRRFGNDIQIVRCKLIKPKHQADPKLYKSKHQFEQGDEGPKQVLIEFASIKQAASARKLFNDAKVKDFEQSTAKYMRDPISDPRTRQPWCQCESCNPLCAIANPSLVSASVEPEGSVIGAASTVGSTTGSTRTTVTGLEAAILAGRDGTLNYDAKEDARHPDEY